MKKIVCTLLAICLLVPSLALANGKVKDETIPDFCNPILEEWNATNGKELHLHILEYWKSVATYATDRLNAKSLPLNIRLGGTTKELIDDKKNWDMAIVSSQDVNLQMLADEGLIMSSGNAPILEQALHQWLLPQSVQDKLPSHPILLYEVYCYDYNAQTDNAIFLICQENIGKKKNSPRLPGMFAKQILQQRDSKQIRALEGMCRVNNWTLDGIAELNQDDLLLKADEWDFATLRIKTDDKLVALDQAGLLIDFSQDEYWRTRNAPWIEPNGVFGADHKMIAIPFDPFVTGDYEADTFLVLVANKQSANISKILAYAEHFIKSFEWIYGCIENDTTPSEIQKYGICIYKDDVDW